MKAAATAPVRIVGLDLAWGERNGDGLCLLHVAAPGGRVEVAASAHVFGDTALFAWLKTHLGQHAGPALVCVDAPLLCPNATGSRPADREAQRLFARYHAGPHPANVARCARPLRIAAALRERLGLEIGWDLETSDRLALEVFPHPATVRWFGLPRIVKYKRGPVAARRAEFARLQKLLRAWLAAECREMAGTDALEALLTARWTKPAEDQLDALLCALVGWQHWKHRGRRSEVLGDAASGFIVLPAAAGAG